jgi:hypothetical protein
MICAPTIGGYAIAPSSFMQHRKDDSNALRDDR